MPKITIKVDPELCIGAASCVTVSPEFFQLNDKNKAVVMDHGADGNLYERVVEVSDEEVESILLSAQSCPTLAISVFDENGNQLFPEI